MFKFDVVVDVCEVSFKDSKRKPIPEMRLYLRVGKYIVSEFS